MQASIDSPDGSCSKTVARRSQTAYDEIMVSILANRTALIAYQRIPPTSAGAATRRSSGGDEPAESRRRTDRITLSAESIALWEAAIVASRATPVDEED